jgi:hypothetical protein
MVGYAESMTIYYKPDSSEEDHRVFRKPSSLRLNDLVRALQAQALEVDSLYHHQAKDGRDLFEVRENLEERRGTLFYLAQQSLIQKEYDKPKTLVKMPKEQFAIKFMAASIVMKEAFNVLPRNKAYKLEAQWNELTAKTGLNKVENEISVAKSRGKEEETLWFIKAKNTLHPIQSNQLAEMRDVINNTLTTLIETYAKELPDLARTYLNPSRGR